MVACFLERSCRSGYGTHHHDVLLGGWQGGGIRNLDSLQSNEEAPAHSQLKTTLLLSLTSKFLISSFSLAPGRWTPQPHRRRTVKAKQRIAHPEPSQPLGFASLLSLSVRTNESRTLGGFFDADFFGGAWPAQTVLTTKTQTMNNGLIVRRRGSIALLRQHID